MGAFTTDNPDIFNLNCIVLRAQAFVILARNSRRFAAGAHLAGKHFSTYIEPSSDHASKKSHKHAKEGNSRLLVSDGDVRLALSLHQIRYFKPISAVNTFVEKRLPRARNREFDLQVFPSVTYHGDSTGGHDFCWCQHGQISDIYQHVATSHKWNSNHYGQRQVSKTRVNRVV